MKIAKKKVPLNFLIELPIPKAYLNILSDGDRQWLYDISRNKITWDSGYSVTYLFQLEDIYKLRTLFQKYDVVLTYPKSAVLRKYGLKHSSGDTLDIAGEGDAFVCTQMMPDGRIETHIIPKNIVWRVFYTVQRYFKAHPEEASVRTPVLWELLCKEFELNRYFDRTGKFHSNSFFGDRRQYFYFAYYPMKVLDRIRKITYIGKMVSLRSEDDREEAGTVPVPPMQEELHQGGTN
jgi:hypothetical protein